MSNGFEFCRACNSSYGKVVRDYPKRLRDEIKRLVEEPGLIVLALVSSYGDTILDARVMDPLY